MSRYKNGNPKKQSRFICIKCLKENALATGMQRKSQREKNHVKDLYCLYCKDTTKNIEVRYCDIYGEILEKANEIRENYYSEE